jgi:spore coat-associated protein N
MSVLSNAPRFSITPRARVLAAAGVLAVMGVGTSLAVFSDSGDVRTQLTAGTVDLRFDDDQDGTPDPYDVVFSTGYDSLAPGSVVTYDLVVYNSGSIPATGTMAVPVLVSTDPDADDQLADQLTLTITDTAGTTTLYDGDLADATLAGLDLPADGSTATGTTLRFAVTMSGTAPEAVGGQGLQITFPFTATQTDPS